MRTLFIECVSGIAGDMFASAFLDAGLISHEEVRALPARIGWPDVQIEIRPVVRASIKATSIEVSAHGETWKQTLEATGRDVAPSGKIQIRGHAQDTRPHLHHHGHHHNHDGGWHTRYADLERFLASRDLPASVIQRARDMFYHLARAEADAHGMAIEDVAFHEVGAYDSIIDVLLAALCLERANADEVQCTSVPVGRGFVKIAHGVHPVPPPASANLLRGIPVAPVPGAIQKENVELATPTGLAILKSIGPQFRWDWPSGVPEVSGMGAGHMDLGNYPNIVRISILQRAASEPGSGLSERFTREQVVQCTFHVDDQTGEETGRFIQRAMEAGALDVQAIYGTGKKGRPSLIIQIVAKPELRDQIVELVLVESKSFGVRVELLDRYRLNSTFETRGSSGSEVRYRVGTDRSGRFVKEKREFDDTVS